MAFVHNMAEDSVGIVWIYDVNFSVGPGRRNHQADVQLVQHGLNTLLAPLVIPGKNGLPIKNYLKRDGIYGRKTSEAIHGFQKRLQQLGLFVASDGIVSPSSPSGWNKDGSRQYTIVYLNRMHRDIYGTMMDEEQFPEPLKSNVKANAVVG